MHLMFPAFPYVGQRRARVAWHSTAELPGTRLAMFANDTAMYAVDRITTLLRLVGKEVESRR